MERYEILDCVGEGTYGLVLRCVHKRTGTHVAIKKFKESKDQERVRRTAARELEVLQTLHHPNLVSFLESFRTNGQLHLAFEFMDKTLLHDMEQMPRGIPYESVESHMLQLVHAVHFLHQNKVMHRDLKPENMLLSEEGVLKLCDFGFARHLGGPNTMYSEYVATRWYRPPELLLGYTKYGLAVDVWALGCLLVEMASGEPLFPGKTDLDQLWLIMKTTGPLPRHQMQVMQQSPHLASLRVPPHQMKNTLECRFPRLTHKQLHFVKACIQADPARRPTCAQLLQFPFLQDAACNLPSSLIAAQEASQQRIAAFRAQAHLLQTNNLKAHKGRKAVNINVDASRTVDAGFRNASDAADVRSPHGRQPVPGPFLSPNAASFYPRQPLGSARARDQALPEQARDARQPDWNTQESKDNANRQAMGKGKKQSKQQIGFRMDSLPSSGSGLIGTARTSPGGSGSTPRNSKRSLLSDLMMEGEQSPEGCLDVPSSPPKKFKPNSTRPENPSACSSDQQLPQQASMTNDRGHVMLGQPEQKALLGAESLVSRAPLGAECNGPDDHPSSQRDSDDTEEAAHAAAAGMTDADWMAQPAESALWHSALQGQPGQWAEVVYPQGQPAATGPHTGQMAAPAEAGGQFWDDLDDQYRQQSYPAGDCYSADMDPLHASHRHQSHSFQDWAAVPMALQGCEQNQYQHQADADALPAREPIAWPIPLPQMHQQQQQQPQQALRFPSVEDFNPADCHTSASPPCTGMRQVVIDGQDDWQSNSSPEHELTESDVREQVMLEGHSDESQRADAGRWHDQNVPQVQMMSREADVCGSAAHIGLLNRACSDPSESRH